MESNSLKIALSKYLVKMSDTCRSPPNRITLHREVITRDNIDRVAQSRRCYKLQGGITESSRQLRAENDNQLCNSQLRGTGEVFHLPWRQSSPHSPQSFSALALVLRAEYASDARSNRCRESQNRLADIGLHGNTYLLPKARLDTARIINRATRRIMRVHR